MSSCNEGLPLAAVEAAGAGLPVVAPRVGGLRDCARWGLVHGAERDPAALAAVCAEVLARPRPPPHPLALALGGPRISGRYLDLYHQIAGCA